jgi:hypothetical protein
LAQQATEVRPPLTPSQRSLRASIAAHTRLALYDPKELTAAANAANSDSWERRVDPKGSSIRPSEPGAPNTPAPRT